MQCLYLRYHAEAFNECRGLSPRISAWPTQIRRNIAAVETVGDTASDLTGVGIKPQTSRTLAVFLITPPTGRYEEKLCEENIFFLFWSLQVHIRHLTFSFKKMVALSDVIHDFLLV